jgi:hypothetical protein
MQFHRRHSVLVTILVVALPISVRAQAFQGYTLYSQNRNTYLMNMNNQTVKTWTHARSGAYSCYLMPDGILWRTSTSSVAGQIGGGGATGIVEKVAWDGTQLWQYTYASSQYRMHHDICPMPNGNVLFITWEVKTAAQALQAGRRTATAIWPDAIFEIQPVGSNGGNVVWEWHAWDHLIQDFDPTKDNYGVVADHPELFDINMGSTGTDWMHMNGLSYNPRFDQIAISSHNLNEVYVIDHSTTTQEARGHTGGRSGRGGDILYRWGRPANYRAPGAQVFNVVHCAYWVPYGLPGEGNLMAFNNRNGTGASMIVELVLPVDSAGRYTWTPGTAYAPASPAWSYSATGFYANHLGGVQRLPNGNTLIAQSTSARLFEVTTAGTVVWSFQGTGEIIRTQRYPLNYSGILLTGVEQVSNETPERFELRQNYPNPFNPTTTIEFQIAKPGSISLTVFNILGKEVATVVHENLAAGVYKKNFDASGLASGVYLYKLQAGNFSETRKMIVTK